MFLDCISCLVRQAADAVKMSALSDEDQKALMHQVLQWIGEMDFDRTPPAVSQMIHRRLRTLLRTEDPYRPAKDQHNHLAAALIPSIRQHIQSSPDPLLMAVRYAIAGNIIDLGAKNNIGYGDIYTDLQSAPLQPVYGDMNTLKTAIGKANTILYLADNAGEIFFDRLFIEQLSHVRVTLAVRGTPVINDATLDDALTAGINDIASILSNGSDAPGTLLDDCSDEFRRRFDEADVIIAKGQGNFESLCDAPRDIFFLFRTKCSIISRHSGFCIGTYVAANRDAMPRFSSGGAL